MKKIMSVGQCNPDHSSIKTFLTNHFECEIIRIDSTEQALNELSQNKYDLVLVNRKLDIDYTDGTILIKAMKENPSLKYIPVMLISNYPEYQEEAVQLGAVYGFGKAELGKPIAIERLSEIFTIKTN
jgi:two-component system chemotaxis response regulator CheY